MPRRFAFLLVIVFFLGAAPSSEAKPRDPAHAITSQLICPCSCGEVVSGCICETGMSMKATVENGIKAGKSKFIWYAIIFTSLITYWAVHEALESPDRP